MNQSGGSSESSLHPPHDDEKPRQLHSREMSADKKPTRQRAAIPMELPEDFLRIPRHEALKLPNKYGVMEWKVVATMEEEVILAHRRADPEMMGQRLDKDSVHVHTAVFSRDIDTGLGIQLREWNGYIFVNCLVCPNGNRIVSEESYQIAVESRLDWREFGPAFVAGVKPRDQILGVNGVPFLRWGSSCQKFPTNNNTVLDGHVAKMSARTVLMSAARMMRATGDPIVLHLLRDDESCVEDVHGAQIPKSLAFESGDDFVQIDGGKDDDDTLTTKSDLSSSGRGDSWHVVDGAHVGTIINQNHYDIHPLMDQFVKKGLIKSKKEQVHLSRFLYKLTTRAGMWKKNSYLLTSSIRNPLSYYCHFGSSIDFQCIRQALCVHIVNTFVEKGRLAYTIYVLDVESKTEWYAPIRFYTDFQDLRTATSRLNKDIEKLPFPNSSWFGNDDELSLSQHMKDMRRKQLEQFLRGLCCFVYSAKIDPSVFEIAIFVQTFLGCDAQVYDHADAVEKLRPNPDVGAKARISEAIQLYTFRLFLMPTFQTLITRFIDDVKRRAILIEEKKVVTLNSSDLEKERIILELVTIKHVFMNILDLIQKGCMDDFKAMALSIMQEMDISKHELDTFLDPLVRDAVREQIEIEAYVPCRSIISSMIVHGWRYEDKIISYKIIQLRRKSQSFFKIQPNNHSPSGWHSVVRILSDGVGRSTLPCNKLKAIVDAGKEISRLRKEEHPGADEQKLVLCADDFLPIFIYCVVNAELDRPCALCALLKHLCDDMQQIGEVGYYLSSFEAAIMYIHELDLSSAD